MVGRYIFPAPSDEALQVFEEKINYPFGNDALPREALQAFGISMKMAIRNLPSSRVRNAHRAKQGFIHGINRFVVTHPSRSGIMPNVMATGAGGSKSRPWVLFIRHCGGLQWHALVCHSTI
ncbi:hypothetical protein N7537_007464 [Penicillium hordei]|uniref:Uncharacterized protein n=1 Tax=Penicillium hordei TaxID=40994 RepID=A0AAD6GXH8_9EURO|nr:uncharacterized protein N7537_007464 [Penicillium hordei]KAJ5597380.1 hypothetical protein N7537_007464 [Penicillium hordei]